MRYSDQELLSLACSSPTIEGRIWYKQQRRRKENYRERLFRLKSNFLFYFRIHESSKTLDPLGALLLERCSIREEAPDGGRLVFSLEYQDEQDHRHFFAVSSPNDYRSWLNAVKAASYERLKSTVLLLQRELDRVKDIQHNRDVKPMPTRPAPRRPPRRPHKPPAVKQQPTSTTDNSTTDISNQESQPQDVREEGSTLDIT